MRRSAAAAGLLLASLLSAAPCAAHDPWRSEGFVHRAEDPDTMVVVTNRGLLLSQDGGGEWRFLCETAMAALSGVPPVGTGEQSLVWGLFRGYYRASLRGCEASKPSSALDELWPVDIRLDPTSNDGLFAATGSGKDAANGVFHSMDGGASWQRLGDGDDNFAYRELRLSSDAGRLYGRALDYSSNDFQQVIRYTDDDGDNWVTHPLPDDPGVATLKLLGVDPSDPTRLYAAALACEPDLPCPPSSPSDRLLRSEDSGASWQSVREVDSLGGFAVSESHVWLGDLGGGLWVSEDQGDNWEQLDAEQAPRCLHHDATGLYACGETYNEGFVLARSMDQGESFEPILKFHDVGEDVACEVDSLDVESQCAATWQDLCLEDFADDPTPPAVCPPPETGSDAGAEPDGGGEDASTAGSGDGGPEPDGAPLDSDGMDATREGGSGGGCSAAPARPAGPWLALLLAATAALLGRRHARR